MPARSRLKDVAERAGLSVATVSRALRDDPQIALDTRERVRRLAKEMGYRPDGVARSLVGCKSRTLGFVAVGESADLTVRDPFGLEVITAVKEAAGAQGYDLVLFSVSRREQEGLSYVDMCAERRVDGAVLMGLREDDPEIQAVVSAEIPAVFIDIPVTGRLASHVISDNAGGLAAATSHLIGLGHRRILFMNGHPYAAVSRLRLDGYRRAMARDGLTADERVVQADFSEAMAYQQTLCVLRSGRRPTGIVAASDLMALGVMRAARHLGLEIPSDLSVVGFDDIAVSSLVVPSLTTVRQDARAIGREAVRLLLALAERSEPLEPVVVPTQLIARGSSAAVPASESTAPPADPGPQDGKRGHDLGSVERG